MTDRWLYGWALGSVAFGGASLLIPLYVVQLGATPFDLGILAATAAAIGAPGAILFGRLANQVRLRRRLVVATMATVAAVLALVPFLEAIAPVIVANAVLWLVVASVAPVLTMLIVEGVPESVWSERIGLLNKYQGYGWAGGLVLGTIWPAVAGLALPAAAATRALFWLLALAAGASTLLVAGSLPKTAADANVPAERKSERIARALSAGRQGVKGATFAFTPNRLYWTTRGLHPRRVADRLDGPLATYLVAAGLFFTGSAAFWAPLPLYLTDLNFDSGTVFGLYLVSSLGSAVLYERAGAVATEYDVRTLQSVALAGRGLLFPALGLLALLGSATALGAAAVGLVLVGVTWAVIAVVGTAIVSRLSPPAVRGDLLGVHTALGAVAGGVGSVLGGWAASLGYDVAFALAGGLVLVGALLVFSLGQLSGSGSDGAASSNQNSTGTD